MNEFLLSDLRHLQASEGWLGLGDWRSAKAELDEISAESRTHPSVLRMLFRACSEGRDWAGALEAATALSQLLPDNAEPWIGRSYALHELKRTAEAKENLLQVAGRFPKLALIHYNLACYEAQLGNVPHARKLLERAFHLPGGEDLRLTAKDDPDLAPLR